MLLFNISLLSQLSLFRSKQYNQNSSDKIELRGLRETVLWGELDRWDYTDPQEPGGTPPPYSIYTFLTLGQSFTMFLILMGLHTLAMLVVKIATSEEFRKKENFTIKCLHVIQNLSMATPYQDWDEGVFTIPQYRERFRRTNIEMLWCLIVNIVVSLIMIIPLCFTGDKHFQLTFFILKISTLLIFAAYKVHERHNFLISLLGVTKPEEDVSYANVTNLVISVTVCTILFSLGEATMYFIYNYEVQLICLAALAFSILMHNFK